MANRVTTVTLQKLMQEFVNEMLSKGPESPRLDELLKNHANETEFVRLANVARRLKRSANETRAKSRTDASTFE